MLTVSGMVVPFQCQTPKSENNSRPCVFSVESTYFVPGHGDHPIMSRCVNACFSLPLSTIIRPCGGCIKIPFWVEYYQALLWRGPTSWSLSKGQVFACTSYLVYRVALCFDSLNCKTSRYSFWRHNPSFANLVRKSQSRMEKKFCSFKSWSDIAKHDQDDWT